MGNGFQRWGKLYTLYTEVKSWTANTKNKDKTLGKTNEQPYYPILKMKFHRMIDLCLFFEMESLGAKTTGA